MIEIIKIPVSKSVPSKSKITATVLASFLQQQLMVAPKVFDIVKEIVALQWNNNKLQLVG